MAGCQKRAPGGGAAEALVGGLAGDPESPAYECPAGAVPGAQLVNELVEVELGRERLPGCVVELVEVVFEVSHGDRSGSDR